MNLFIEISRKETEFIEEIKSLSNSQDLQVIESDAFAGIDDVVTIIASLTPAITFVIGKYFGYLKSKHPEITIKIDGVEVYSKDISVESTQKLLDALKNDDQLTQ